MSFFKELKRRNVFRVGIAYTVATWLLIQVTDTVFPRIGLPDSAVTLVIALLVIGFIPALILAWAFEMTPDGIKLEKDVDRTQSITPTTGRKLDRMIIGILTVAVGYLLVDKLALRGSELFSQQPAVQVSELSEEKRALTPTAIPVTGQSIAVLPFVNMSADADNEYFSDGISEELLNVLVKVSTLHVASRTSAFAYKGKDLPLSQIARELNVENILEGSVRKAGNRVRITAQLINANSDRHIWSETYERELVDIFDIQEEISANIVAALKIALNVDERDAVDRAGRPTENTEAYELYLQGRYAWRLRHEDNIRRSIELFEKAIAQDPNFARAYEGLASAWSVLPSWADVSQAEAGSHAKAAAIHALQLDPTLSEARAALSESAFLEHRWADGLAEYQQAISNDPRNPTLHQWLGEAFAYMGFNSKALAEMRIAYELDPASPVINQSMVWLATTNHEDDLAIKHAEISKGLGVGKRGIYNSLDAMVRQGNWDAVFAGLDTLDDVPDVVKSCYRARQDPSLRAQLPAQLDQFIQASDDEKSRDLVIDCLAFTGQADRASKLAVTNIDADWTGITSFWSSNSSNAAMRKTEIFRKTLADMDLLDFYREQGWPDLCHPVGEDDFQCD